MLISKTRTGVFFVVYDLARSSVSFEKTDPNASFRPCGKRIVKNSRPCGQLADISEFGVLTKMISQQNDRAPKNDTDTK